MEHRDARCTVWVDKFVAGWDGGETLPGVHTTLSVTDALLDVYNSDAHFVPYHIVVDDVPLPKAPRLTVASLKTLSQHNARAVFDLGVVDVDCAEAHREDTEAPEGWRIEMRDLAEQAVPGCWHYDTKRGLRIVWVWPEPLSPEQHSERLGHAITALRTAGLPVDDLRDATRCFRAAMVMRDGVAQWPMFHMPDPGPAVWDPPNAPALSAAVPAVYALSKTEVVQSVWDAFDNYREPFTLPREIEEGTRHNTLKRYAASMRAKNMERDQIEVALRDYEARAGAHLRPYQGTAEGERDLMGILDWVCALAPGPSKRVAARASNPAGKTYNGGDDGSGVPPVPPEEYETALETGSSVECALWVLRQIERSGVPCVFDLGVLWTYANDFGRFVELPTVAVHRLLHTMDNMLVKGNMLKDGTQKYTRLKVSNSFACDVVMVIQQQRKQPGFFDACSGVSFADCFVEVTPQGIVQHPHSPEHRCNFGYDEPYTTQDPARFTQFLQEVLADLSAADLQTETETLGEWIGAVLTRLTTIYQKAVMIEGGGSNGKSQFVEMVEGLLPASRVTHFPPQALAGDYNRAKLAKSMLNATTEVPSTEVNETASAVIKALISGDPMSARFPYESPFDFVPRGAVLLAANTLPAIRDHSYGMWRRIHVVSFKQEFSGANRVRNIGKLILDAERVQIACWALRQLVNLLSRGEFRETQASAEAKANWRRASDDVEQWLHDAIDEVPPGNGTKCETLYHSYRLWAESAGIEAGSLLPKRKFYERIKAKFKPYMAGPASARRLEYPLAIRPGEVH